MAVEQRGVCVGFVVASADLRTHQYKPVKLSSTGWALCSVLGEKVAGMLQNKPNTGEVADVMLNGVTKAVAGAAITAGALLMTDATGRVVTAATTGSTIIGWAIDAAGAAGDIITVLFHPAVGVV